MPEEKIRTDTTYKIQITAAEAAIRTTITQAAAEAVIRMITITAVKETAVIVTAADVAIATEKIAAVIRL